MHVAKPATFLGGKEFFFGGGASTKLGAAAYVTMHIVKMIGGKMVFVKCGEGT